MPCVGVRAACSPWWLDSKHLISILCSARPCGGQRRRTATHPSGWTCRAGKRWAGLAWLELPFRWIDWVGWVKGREREKSRVDRDVGKGTRREGTDWGLVQFILFPHGRVSRYGILQVPYCIPLQGLHRAPLTSHHPSPVTNQGKSTVAIFIFYLPRQCMRTPAPRVSA